ncbi:hypothetical protein [Streptomyces sp. NPDC059215]|uniref:hypothetical protein n=1 Tax=Streptomyces sp. NPDC059215 TaxID=3346772 RepID=UPI003694E604
MLRTSKRRVFASNPMAAARYRDRHSVSRQKSKPGDALVVTNVLRTDIIAHRPLPHDSDVVRRRRASSPAHVSTTQPPS